jgi:hypothetical protein
MEQFELRMEQFKVQMEQFYRPFGAKSPCIGQILLQCAGIVADTT